MATEHKNEKAKEAHANEFDEAMREKAKADFRRDIRKSMEELTKQLDDLEANPPKEYS